MSIQFAFNPRCIHFVAMASEKANSRQYDSRAREIIRHVYDVCAAEKQDGKLSMPLSNPLDRTTHLCDVSASTVQRIRRAKSNPSLKPVRSRKYQIDDFDICVLRRIVQTMYEKRQVLPTLENIRNELREAVGYTGSKKYLSKTLKMMGFQYKRCKTDRKILMERPDVVAHRIRFLRHIKKLRDAGYTIVYTDETYIHSSHSVTKAWQSESTGLNQPLSKGDRIIVVHAGTSKGFINGAQLVYDANSSTGDYHKEMNFEYFMKWLQTQLIPNLPEKSALVLDNAAYHNVQEDKCPTQSSRKDAMRDWLQRHQIPFTMDMLRPELLELCKLHKPRVPVFQIDKLLKSHGHTAIRLPPYHAELNAIELIWSNLKGFVGRRNLEFKKAKVETLTQEGIESIGEKEWSACCKHVMDIEQEFWRRDIAVEEEVDRVIIYVDSDSDVSDSEDTDTASEGNESTDTAEESKLFV